MKTLFLVLGMLLTLHGTMAQAADCACCTENHKAFDFWIGTWEVTGVNGTLVGTNTIRKEQDGCVLRENWTGATGQYTGTSLNFYNTQTAQWEQLWIDNSGSPLKLKGNRIANQMILSSEPFKQADGKEYRNRIIWTLNKDKTVRQLWEVLNDADTPVNTLFDGLYTKKE
ncbi:MAG: hypothetical protein HKN52_11165 [Eudoraea sp.]|nr:hypothetical protein [Eudoraea sp.]